MLLLRDGLEKDQLDQASLVGKQTLDECLLLKGLQGAKSRRLVHRCKSVKNRVLLVTKCAHKISLLITTEHSQDLLFKCRVI